jgi:hypothetical protein
MRTSRVALRILPLAVAAAAAAACARTASAPVASAPETATAFPASYDSRGDAPPPGLAAPSYGAYGAAENAPPPASVLDAPPAAPPVAEGGKGAMLAPPASYVRSNAVGSIAAGEWNDNANYHEFQKWLATEAQLPVQRLDVSHRRFLVVRDEEGRAVPGCNVELTGYGGQAPQRVTLVTGPSGRALFFPRAEGFDDDTATATAACAGGRVTRSVSLSEPDGVVDLRLPIARQLAPPQARVIDVAFILDTTGSMSEEIASVKTTIARVAAGLGGDGAEVRIGLVEYKDRGDPFVTRVYPFSTDVKAFAASVGGLAASGGGDTPESVNEGIHVALSQLDWHRGSVGRFAFLVGDAPPHLDYAQDYSYAADMKSAAHRGIQIFTIAASGMDEVGQVVWRQIAQYTNAANMFVLRGGAGPQSVGGGDPRSSCGGTHSNYTSGHLDALILGKIRGELRALDGDPLRIAGLNEDEDTKPCDRRIVMQ